MFEITHGAFVVVFANESENPMKSEIYIVRHNYGQKKCSLPGGAMHGGESPEVAALRETKEETNLLLKNVSLIGIFHSRKNAGKLTFLFKALGEGMTSILDAEEIAEIQAVTVEQALTELDLYPAQRVMLAAYVASSESQGFIIDYLSTPDNEQLRKLL